MLTLWGVATRCTRHCSEWYDDKEEEPPRGPAFQELPSGRRQELSPNVALSKEANRVNHTRIEKMKLKGTLERYTAVSRRNSSSWRNSMYEGMEV